MSFTVRSARKPDMGNVLEMVQEMANFSNKPGAAKLEPEDLIRDGGFDESSGGTAPLYFCFVAETSDSVDRKTVGYALCFNIYSSRKGKALYLVGLYVKPDYRRQGVGKQLWSAVVAFARETNCNHLDFHVLEWNPGVEFYSKLNAVNLTREKSYQLFRLTKEQIYEIHEDVTHIAKDE